MVQFLHITGVALLFLSLPCFLSFLVGDYQTTFERLLVWFLQDIQDLVFLLGHSGRSSAYRRSLLLYSGMLAFRNQVLNQLTVLVFHGQFQIPVNALARGLH